MNRTKIKIYCSVFEDKGWGAQIVVKEPWGDKYTIQTCGSKEEGIELPDLVVKVIDQWLTLNHMEKKSSVTIYPDFNLILPEEWKMKGYRVGQLSTKEVQKRIEFAQQLAEEGAKYYAE